MRVRRSSLVGLPEALGEPEASGGRLLSAHSTGRPVGSSAGRRFQNFSRILPPGSLFVFFLTVANVGSHENVVAREDQGQPR